MKRNSIFYVKTTHKTKQWWIFLSVFLFVFVPFLVLWLLVGEFNLIDKNWLVAQNASVWHGKVTDSNIVKLEKYFIFYNGSIEEFRSKLQEYLANGNQCSIVSYKTFFNPIILAPLLGLFVWSICYPMIFNATKVSGLDVLPFSTSFGSLMLALIFSGLIPHFKNSDLIAVYWILRIIGVFVVAMIFFIISNKFVNKFLSGRSYATDIYFGYKIADEETKLQRTQLKENIDIFKKHKDEEKSYVDIEQEVK